jgi:hypothetical protein
MPRRPKGKKQENKAEEKKQTGGSNTPLKLNAKYTR